MNLSVTATHISFHAPVDRDVPGEGRLAIAGTSLHQNTQAVTSLSSLAEHFSQIELVFRTKKTDFLLFRWCYSVTHYLAS